MSDKLPARCGKCNMFITADKQYQGHRCVCEGSPLVLMYVELCKDCEHINKMDCEPEKCAALPVSGLHPFDGVANSSQ